MFFKFANKFSKKKERVSSENNLTDDKNIALKLENISYAYNKDKPLLQNLNFILYEGECLAILGSSGSGKSTLLSLITGLLPLQEGQIILRGENISKLPTQKRNIGLVFQDFALFPHLTVYQNIYFSQKQKDEEETKRLLNLVKMADRKESYPYELSGGEKQRIALARALAAKPKILLLDEPFSNLDTDLKAGLRAELKEILKQEKISSILVTHDLADAKSLADNIFELTSAKLLVKVA